MWGPSMGICAPVYRRHCRSMPKSSHVVRMLVDADAAQTGGQEGRASVKTEQIVKTHVKVISVVCLLLR